VQRAEHHPWRIAIGVAIAAVLVIAGYAWLRGRGSSKPAYRFELALVDHGALRAKVTATGTVNPIKQVQVGSQVSGTIQSLGADYNSVVTPGQLIAQIDPRPFQAAVNQAKANLLAARAKTRQARANAIDARRIANRNAGLARQNLIAQQTADTSEATARAAQAAVDAAAAAEVQAQAALESAQLQLSYTSIVSPIKGTVITRNVDVGQTVAASFQAPTLFLIGEDLTKMQVDTTVAEADVGRLARGMIATFTVDAYPSEEFQGRIREIRNSPQVTQNVVTYNAVVDVDNPDLKLKPGMTANLEVVYAERADAVRVPNAAIRFRPPPEVAKAEVPHGKKLVWVQRAGMLAPIPITPGASDGTYTEVLDHSLVPGQTVVTEAISTRPQGQGR